MKQVVKDRPKVVKVLVLRGYQTTFVFIEPDWAKAAKEQAVIDAKERAEAAEREKLEAEQAAKEAEEAAKAAAAAPPAEEAPAAAAAPKAGMRHPALVGFVAGMALVLLVGTLVYLAVRDSGVADTAAAAAGSSDEPHAETDALPAEVRLYDRLFKSPNPGAAEDVIAELNPGSLEIVDARLEANLRHAALGDSYQFERLGYFCPDAVDYSSNKPVFNRIVTLRDSWAKIEKQALQGQ